MIYYWNKKYFKGMKAIGEAYAQRPGFELFSEYCLKKEQGMKSDANDASRNFSAVVRNFPAKQQREIIVDLCELNRTHQHVHSIINFPIRKLITTVLEEWVIEQPDLIDAYRWYARYCENSLREKILKRALEIDPNDQLCVSQSIAGSLHGLQYMVHHLNENILLGDLEEADFFLRNIETLLIRVLDLEEKSRVQIRFEYYKTLFGLWRKYETISDDAIFVDWARKNEGFEL